MKPDQFDYINRYYGLSVKKGQRVIYSGGSVPTHGTITGTESAHLMIKLDGAKHATPFHPTWKIQYVDMNS